MAAVCEFDGLTIPSLRDSGWIFLAGYPALTGRAIDCRPCGPQSKNCRGHGRHTDPLRGCPGACYLLLHLLIQLTDRVDDPPRAQPVVVGQRVLALLAQEEVAELHEGRAHQQNQYGGGEAEQQGEREEDRRAVGLERGHLLASIAEVIRLVEQIAADRNAKR